MLDSELKRELQSKWDPTVERCGVILRSGEVKEVPNRATNPSDEYVIETADVEEFLEDIVASWHTHPRTSANLSMRDYAEFGKRPEWFHYIVAEGDDVRCYFSQHGRIILHDDEDDII